MMEKSTSAAAVSASVELPMLKRKCTDRTFRGSGGLMMRDGCSQNDACRPVERRYREKARRSLSRLSPRHTTMHAQSLGGSGHQAQQNEPNEARTRNLGERNRRPAARPRGRSASRRCAPAQAGPLAHWDVPAIGLGLRRGVRPSDGPGRAADARLAAVRSSSVALHHSA